MSSPSFKVEFSGGPTVHFLTYPDGETHIWDETTRRYRPMVLNTFWVGDVQVTLS